MEYAILTEQSVRRLIDAGEPPCIAIYTPLGPKGTEQNQDRIRLKNQIDRAERGLEARGIQPRERRDLIDPIRDFPDQRIPAADGPATLAIFRAPGFLHTALLPIAAPEISFVGDAFCVSPLLPLVNVNEHFRVLLLSQDQVRLFEGDRHSFAPRQVPKLPAGKQDALGDDDDRDETLQFHTEAVGHSGNRPAVFHGHVRGEEHAKERILRFCQLVDKALCSHIEDQDVPLILAATEPLPGIYRQANSYRNLHAQVIPVDSGRFSEAETHARAWSIVEPQAIEDRETSLGKFTESLANSRGSVDASAALEAALEGRVAMVFVNANLHRPSADETPTEPSRDDRVHRAVAETLRRGGRAFLVPNEEMPEHAAVGALYRY